MIKFTRFLILMLFLAACEEPSPGQRMHNTSLDVLSSVRKKDLNKFKSLIGPELKVLGKDEDILREDFEKLGAAVLKPSLYEDAEMIFVTNLYNGMGQRLVDIPIVTRKGMSPDSIVHIWLLFGPPAVYPLYKITGYELTRGQVKPEGFSQKQ